MGDTEIPDELVDQLLRDYEGPEDLTGPEGLLNRLRKRLIERAGGARVETVTEKRGRATRTA